MRKRQKGEASVELTSYISLLPLHLWLNIIFYLPPFPFCNFQSTCKQFSNAKLQQKYFTSWFEGQGCAAYQYPNVAKYLSKLSMSTYYTIVDDLIREFKLVALVNELEPNEAIYTRIYLCKKQERLIVYSERRRAVMEFLTKEPFTMTNEWEIDGTNITNCYFTESNEDYCMIISGEYMATKMYRMKPGAPALQDPIPGDHYYHEGYEIRGKYKLYIGGVLKVKKDNKTLWKRISKGYAPGIVHVAAGVIVMQHDEALYLISIESGKDVGKLFFPSSSRLVIIDVKLVKNDKCGRLAWLIVVVQDFIFHSWYIEESNNTRSTIPSKLQLKKSMPVSVCIHPKRVLVIYSDGSVDVVSMGQVFPTVVNFSGTNIVSATSTKDSTVFFTTSTGVLLAVNFSTTEVWTSPPLELHNPITSQDVNKVITTMLRKIGNTMSSIAKATTQNDLELFLELYHALKNWYTEVVLCKKIERIENSSFINLSLEFFGRIEYLITATSLISKQQFKPQFVLQKDKLNDLLNSLNKELAQISAPRFPLRNILEDLLIQSKYSAEFTKINSWAMVAIKEPKSITLDKIEEQKLSAKKELENSPDFYKLAMEAIEGVIPMYLSKLSQTIICSVTSCELAITSSSTFQNKILDDLQSLTGLSALKLIFYDVQNCLKELIENFQTRGDLNILNQSLTAKCLQNLNTFNTSNNIDNNNNDTNNDNNNKYDTNKIKELESLAVNFISSLETAKDSNNSKVEDVEIHDSSEEYSENNGDASEDDFE